MILTWKPTFEVSSNWVSDKDVSVANSGILSAKSPKEEVFAKLVEMGSYKPGAKSKRCIPGNCLFHVLAAYDELVAYLLVSADSLFYASGKDSFGQPHFGLAFRNCLGDVLLDVTMNHRVLRLRCDQVAFNNDTRWKGMLDSIVLLLILVDNSLTNGASYNWNEIVLSHFKVDQVRADAFKSILEGDKLVFHHRVKSPPNWENFIITSAAIMLKSEKLQIEVVLKNPRLKENMNTFEKDILVPFVSLGQFSGTTQQIALEKANLITLIKQVWSMPDTV
jgi:hypothetical protein